MNYRWRMPSVMVLVMRVGHMRVPVLESAMLVRMRVRLPRRIVGAMHVLMMRVMNVGMRVREHLMVVLMLMIFGEMQPHANRHEGAGNKEADRGWLPESDDRHHRAEERRGREIGASTGRAEVAKRQHEQREAHPIAEEADHARDQR